MIKAAGISVYEHWRPDKDECFYVGMSGRDVRLYRDLKRNKYHGLIVKKLERFGLRCEVKIVAHNLSWDEAQEVECYLIKKYGRRDLGLGSLVNLTDGGDGANGVVRTDENKRNISAGLKEFWNRPENKTRRSKIMKAAWKGANEWRVKSSKIMTAYNSSPEAKANRNEWNLKQKEIGQKRRIQKRVVWDACREARIIEGAAKKKTSLALFWASPAGQAEKVKRSERAKAQMSIPENKAAFIAKSKGNKFAAGRKMSKQNKLAIGKSVSISNRMRETTQQTRDKRSANMKAQWADPTSLIRKKAA